MRKKEQGAKWHREEEEEEEKTSIPSPLSVRKRCVSLMMRRGRAAAAIVRPLPAKEERKKKNKGGEKGRREVGALSRFAVFFSSFLRCSACERDESVEFFFSSLLFNPDRPPAAALFI